MAVEGRGGGGVHLYAWIFNLIDVNTCGELFLHITDLISVGHRINDLVASIGQYSIGRSTIN